MGIAKDLEKRLMNAELDSLEKPIDALVFLYLLHHPDYPKRIADIFRKSKWNKEDLTSVCQQPHVASAVTRIKRKGLIYKPKEPKKRGRKPMYFSTTLSKRALHINPYLLAVYKDKSNLNINLPYALALMNLIKEISRGEKETIKWISDNYKKFDSATIFIHLQVLLSVIIRYLKLLEDYDKGNWKTERTEHANKKKIKTTEKKYVSRPHIKKELEKLQDGYFLDLKKIPNYLKETYKKKKPASFFLNPIKTLEGMKKRYSEWPQTAIWAERVKEDVCTVYGPRA
jgi:hypothetical protein